MTKDEILKGFLQYLDEITDNEQQIDEYIESLLDNLTKK